MHVNVLLDIMQTKAEGTVSYSDWTDPIQRLRKECLTYTNCLKAEGTALEMWNTLPSWCWSMSFESRVSKVWQMSIRWQHSHSGLKRSPHPFYLKYRAALLICCLWVLYHSSFEYHNPHRRLQRRHRTHSWINKASSLCKQAKRPCGWLG